MKQEVVKYRDEVYLRALERSKLEWDSSGLATYGGLAAVVGAVADRTGLMNTGIGFATLGLANSSRYRFHDQTQIYVAALKRLACITGKVNAADDVMIAKAKLASDPTAQAAAINFIKTVVASVDYVRSEYTNGLLGLSPTVPTRDELMAMVNRFSKTAIAVADTGSNQAAADEAGEVVKGLAAEVQACSKV